MQSQNCSPEADECIDDFKTALKIEEIGELIQGIQTLADGVFQFEIVYDEKNETHRYQLIQCGCDDGDTPDPGENRTRIFTNPGDFYVDSGPIMGLYTFFDPNADRLVQVLDGEKVFNKKVRERIDEDLISVLGLDDSGSPNFDSLDSAVDASIISLTSAKSYFNDTKRPGFVIPIEAATSPLQRAELVKLVALLLDRVDDGVKLFSEVKERYNVWKKRVAEEGVRRSSVFFNNPYLSVPEYNPNDSYNCNFRWDQPEASSYLLVLLEDAGADYLSPEDEGPLKMRPDNIVRYFGAAYFLLNSGRTDVLADDRTLEEYVRGSLPGGIEDDEYTDNVINSLTAVRCGNVWSDQKLIAGETTGFAEEAVIEPDEVLADYIKILHPYIESDRNETKYLYSLGDADADSFRDECPLRTLEGKPPDGTTYVDLEFTAFGMSRFNVDEIITTEGVLETLGISLEQEFNIPKDKVELYFPVDDRGVREPVLIVRAPVKNENIDTDTNKTFDFLLPVLQREISKDVRPVGRPSPSPSPTPSPSPSPKATNGPGPNPSGGGGLSGGGIAGIVIVVLVAVGIGICLIRMRRRRSRQRLSTIAPQQGDEAWGGGGAGGYTNSGDGLEGSVGNRGNGRRALGGRGRKMPRAQTGQPDERRDSDPFDI